MMTRLMSGFVLASIMVLCIPARGFDVVKDGSPQCSIVLSPRASPSERLAAEELAAYVKKMSGATLPAMAENTKNGIIIGTLGSLTNIPVTARERLKACNSDEAFYIRSEGDNLFIIGKQPIGALYGTYTLLEDYMGVRWFYPGELGEYCPAIKTMALPIIDDFQKPAMATRTGLPNAPYDSAIWCARQKIQLMNVVPTSKWFDGKACAKERSEFLNQALNTHAMQGGHPTFIMAVPDALFKEHPEYFVLRDGERKLGGHAGGFQRCVSNPDVFKLVAEYILKWCNENPDNVFLICSADNKDGWCQCEECKKMGTVDGTYKNTNLFHRFFSNVLGYVLERNPDARVDVRFYVDRGIAPDDKTIQYRGKNVRGVYCTCWPHTRCYAHNFTDPNCAFNRKCLEDLKGVLKICPRIYTYEYIETSDVPYAPLDKTLAQDIKDLAAIQVEGFMNSTHAPNSKAAHRPAAPYVWQARWASIYLTSKLHWNTKLDPEKIMDDAYDKYYGKAAPAMKKYQALRMKLWESAPGHAFYGGPKRTAYCLTVPGAEEELRSDLAAAKKLAGDDMLVLARIDLDEKFLNMFWKAPAEELKKRHSAEMQILPERVRGAIVIDGDLSEETWLSARPVTGFLKVHTDQPPSEDSNFRVAYDDANLYIGFVAMNNKAWSPETAKAQKRDAGELGQDDHIQLQFAPPDNGDRFYHIILNTKGVLYDSTIVGQDSDLSYDSQAEVKVKKLADRFVYEIRLPLAPMKGDVSPGKVWGMYAFRRSKNLQPPEDKEDSALDGITPHRVMEFRQAVFGENVVKNGNFADRDEKKKKTGE